MWKMITVVLTYLASALRIVADAAILLLKRRLKLYRPVQCCCQNRVRGKVVIVTGASSGIGFAIAQDLASKGAHVYLAGRNAKTGQDAVLKLQKKTGNPAIHFLYLDLQDFCSIHAFVKAFLKCENQLNALVNNAAVFHHPSGLTTDQIEVTYQTNYLGVFLLTNLLQSVLQQSSNPRIVFVTSEAHKLVSVQDLVAFKPRQLSPLTTFSDYVKIYGLSKLALHLYSQHLVESLPGVYVGLADPGNVWTPIYRHSWRSWSLKHMLVRLQCYIFMRDAQEGAQSTIHFLNTPNPRSGQYINSFMVGEEKQPYDSSLVKRLVADSVFLTGLPWSSLPQTAVVTGMRTFNVTGFREVEVVGQHSHTGQPRPREQARVDISLQEVCCSCEIQLLDSKYLSSKAFQSHVLGDAMSALDRALETAFFLMTNDEIARVVVCLSGKLVNVLQDVSVSCIAHLRIEENSRPVYELTPADKLSIAMKYKNMGVSLYKEGLLHKQTLAFLVFSDAVKWLCMIPPDKDKDFLQEVMTVKMQCYNNIALFHLQHHNYNLCVVATTVVLSNDERNVKALYRRAVASTEMQNYEPAAEDLKAALLLDPNSKLLKRQQEVIKRKQKDLTDKYAVAMKKMFS